MVDAKQVFRELKLHGLTLHSDALKRLLSELANQPTLHLDDVVFAIKNSIDRSKLKSSVVSQDALESALDTLLNVSSDNDYQCIQVFNAFEQPKLVYHPSTKSYEVSADPSRKLHASSAHRLSLYRERFAALERRVLRHKSFAKPVASITRQENFQELSRIESLLGVTGMKRVLGMLGQDERKRVYLEDMTSRIYLDISEAKYTNGIFTSTSIVLVEGQVLDDVFHVETIGSPPPELREQSVQILSGVDPLGVEVSAQQLAQIKQLERDQELDCFVVLSDVHLDQPDVMKRLDALFSGYEPFTPTLFILMGNFTSTRVGYGYGAESTTIRTLKQHFDDLATLILKYPALVEKSQFLFVPGPDDPGAPDVVPRHALPTVCTQDFVRRVPSAIMSSNPCRIRYYTQDIVVYRDDLQHKMTNASLFPLPTNAGSNDVSRHLVKTLVDQGHLCPLPIPARPIHWAYDSSLQLFPLPTVLILADKCDQFQVNYAGVSVFHPGPFHIDYSFVLYRPATNATEISRIDLE